MAKSTGTKKSTSQSNRAKTNSTRTAPKKTAADYRKDNELFEEIGLIVFFVLMIILFLCNFGIIGPVGNGISSVLFGVFGLTAYVMPIVLFIAVMFWYANRGSVNALRKLISGIVLFLMIGIVCDLLFGNGADLEKYSIKDLYAHCVKVKNGGGVIAGSISWLLCKYLSPIGTVLVVLLCSAISFILMTEHSLISGVRDGGSRMLERSREGSERRKEYAQQRRQEQEEERARRLVMQEDKSQRQSQKQLRIEEKENEKILRMDKKVSGVADTTLPKKEKHRRDDIHEIVYQESGASDIHESFEASVGGKAEEIAAVKSTAQQFDFDKIRVRSVHQVTVPESEAPINSGMQEITINSSPIHERELQNILQVWLKK